MIHQFRPKFTPEEKIKFQGLMDDLWALGFRPAKYEEQTRDLAYKIFRELLEQWTTPILELNTLPKSPDKK